MQLIEDDRFEESPRRKLALLGAVEAAAARVD
jgi:hypothetical protein